MNNECKTWQQGKFIDSPKYKNWTIEQKKRANDSESLLVRPSPIDNAICVCKEPSQAEWIAQRLNLAAELEQLTYDFATGKTNGDEICDFVKNHLSI